MATMIVVVVTCRAIVVRIAVKLPFPIDMWNARVILERSHNIRSVSNIPMIFIICGVAIANKYRTISRKNRNWLPMDLIDCVFPGCITTSVSVEFASPCNDIALLCCSLFALSGELSNGTTPAVLVISLL